MPIPLRALISQALASPLGLKIQTNNPGAFKLRYYKEMQELEIGQPGLKQQLGLKVNPDDPSELWIVHIAAVKESQWNSQSQP